MEDDFESVSMDSDQVALQEREKKATHLDIYNEVCPANRRQP